MPGPWVSWAKDEDFAKDAKVEIWGVIQAKVLDDTGRALGEGLLRRAGNYYMAPESPTSQALGFGDVGVFEVLVSSDGYYAWGTDNGAECWTSLHPQVGEYHLCKEEVARCQGHGKGDKRAPWWPCTCW